MNIKLRPLQRTNGDVNQPKWDLDDEADRALADRLAPETPPADPDEVTTPPLPPSKPVLQKRRTESVPVPQVQRSEATPRQNVNAKELIEVIVQAWMASDDDRVTIEVCGSDIVIQQVIDENGAKFKRTWSIGISHYRTESRKLIK